MEALSTPPPETPEYEPVEFEDCIKTFTAKTEIELTCSNCQHSRATMSNGFLTLPDVLVITASRFVLKNWVPTKLGPSPSPPPSKKKTSFRIDNKD